MNPQIHTALIPLLERDYGFKHVGEHLRRGECPTCGKKSLFSWFEKPWVLVCQRSNNCGSEFHIKDLYPGLFDDWGQRFPRTEADPHAAAAAYLRDGRGFDLATVAGWYTQDSYYDHKTEQGSTTIRFPMPDANTPGAYWERIIDQAHRFGDRKATFNGSYGGTWWCPPSIKLTETPEAGEIWIAEGIFDAIALMHHGIRAVAAMSCNNYPKDSMAKLAEHFTDKKRPVLVWALDSDKAGRKFTLQWVAKAREAGWECKAAQIPQQGKAKLDWNDMHQRSRLEHEHIKNYLYEGEMLLAKSATDKGLLIYKKTNRSQFAFEFGSQLWWFKFDLEKYNRAREILKDAEDLSDDELRDRALRESGGINHLCNAYPSTLYYQANLLTDESWYYMQVDFPTDQPRVKATFTGSQISAGAEFKKRLLSIAPGAIFKGTTQHLDALMEQQLRGIKTVQTIDFVGYSKDHDAWVFQGICIKDGKAHELNSEDYFELGKLSLKTLSQSVRLHLNTEAKEFNQGWTDLLWTAFKSQGIVALACWLGTLYAEQIRQTHKSFPFLEIVGQPGSGKTTLIEFLWKLLGRVDYEGFDPSKSTPAARSRNFAQVANLPVVLIEADRGDNVSRALTFDWDELKTAYNGRASRSTGVKNGGNETKEPPFRGAIVISQNAPVNASDAILERICHMFFNKAEHSPQGKAASDALSRMPVEQLSGFLLRATTCSAQLLSLFQERFTHYEKDMTATTGLKNIRIVKNHAMLRALLDCLHIVLPALPRVMTDAGHQTVLAMAREREQACLADHPLVQEFWELFDFLNGADGEDNELLNHSRDESVIAISLPHMAQVCADRRLNIPPMADLKRVLSTSRHRKFLEVRTVNSQVHHRVNKFRAEGTPAKPTAVKCWVFSKTNKGVNK